ncbi:hypothetical protein P7K49_026464 [Saguinus oedipus]|uniref:Uncharacterized protein n=1 Tax=Saguinus oedipus TaxID=9490 RepID=A0ABQ9UEM3_SAGOE|nr:hypothetical protein P7K49_026464 [Saguinus oedipus]
MSFITVPEQWEAVEGVEMVINIVLPWKGLGKGPKKWHSSDRYGHVRLNKVLSDLLRKAAKQLRCGWSHGHRHVVTALKALACELSANVDFSANALSLSDSHTSTSAPGKRPSPSLGTYHSSWPSQLPLQETEFDLKSPMTTSNCSTQAMCPPGFAANKSGKNSMFLIVELILKFMCLDD